MSFTLAVMIGTLAASSQAATFMPPAKQNVLVQTYCAVCHTDAVKSGGLSLEHYDASEANPPLAAMLLSKLRNGAMGAAGVGIPDPPVREAWIAATSEQAKGAARWTVIHNKTLTASITREVAPREHDTAIPVYRLTLACGAGRDGEIQLTWSPVPQVNRTFSISTDGNPPTHQTLGGKVLNAGLAAITLNTPLPEKTLAITGLFPGETVAFPIGELDERDRRQFVACFPAGK